MSQTEKVNLERLAEIVDGRCGDDVLVVTDRDTQFFFVVYVKDPHQVLRFGGSATKEQVIDLLKAKQISFQETVAID